MAFVTWSSEPFVSVRLISEPLLRYYCLLIVDVIGGFGTACDGMRYGLGIAITGWTCEAQWGRYCGYATRKQTVCNQRTRAEYRVLGRISIAKFQLISLFASPSMTSLTKLSTSASPLASSNAAYIMVVCMVMVKRRLQEVLTICRINCCLPSITV